MLCQFNSSLLPQPRTLHQRRGVALLVVMACISVASIIAVALLTTAARDVEVRRLEDATLKAHAAAENGFSLAQHLLLHPSDAPATRDEAFYSGTGGEQVLIEDNVTFDISVTQVDDNAFWIESNGRCQIDGGEKLVSIAGRVSRIGSWQPVAPIMGTNLQRVHPNVICSEGLATESTLLDPGAVMGEFICDNYAEFASGKAPEPGVSIAPSARMLTLVKAYSTGGNYIRNGVVERGALLDQRNITSWSSDMPPVVYYDSDSPLILATNASNPITSTIVIINGGLQINGDVVLDAPDGLPAIINLGATEFVGYRWSTVRLTINGFAYFGGDFSSYNTRSVEINGGIIVGGSTSTLGIDNIDPFVINYDPTRQVPNLIEQEVKWESIVVESKKVAR